MRSGCHSSFSILAVASPVDQIGEERLFSVHMLQHLMLGDLAPLLAVLGLSGPLLRPVLALPFASRLRLLAHPLVALPLWAANLYAWHVPRLYDAALAHPAIHATEHACFYAGGLLLWSAILEVLPARAGTARARSSAPSRSSGWRAASSRTSCSGRRTVSTPRIATHPGCGTSRPSRTNGSAAA